MVRYALRITYMYFETKLEADFHVNLLMMVLL